MRKFFESLRGNPKSQEIKKDLQPQQQMEENTEAALVSEVQEAQLEQNLPNIIRKALDDSEHIGPYSDAVKELYPELVKEVQLWDYITQNVEKKRPKPDQDIDDIAKEVVNERIVKIDQIVRERFTDLEGWARVPAEEREAFKELEQTLEEERATNHQPYIDAYEKEMKRLRDPDDAYTELDGRPALKALQEKQKEFNEKYLRERNEARQALIDKHKS